MGFGNLLDRRPAEFTLGTRLIHKIKEGKSKHISLLERLGESNHLRNVPLHVTINGKIKITHLTTKRCKKVGDDIVPSVDTKIHVFDKRLRDMITNPV